MRIRLVTGCLVVLLAVSASWAQPVGTAFTYQGQLNNGVSPANGSFNMVFKLFSVSSGGTQLASQTLPGVSVTDGLFTVQLNFGAGVFDGNKRWLDVTVNGSPLVPRQELTAVPYAHYALNADRLDGLNSTSFLQAVPVPLSLTGSGAHVINAQNTSPDSGAAVQGLTTAAFGTTVGGRFESASDEGIGVLGVATTTMNNGYTSGVHGQAASSIGRGVFGRATHTNGENYGVWGETASTSGRGVYGLATAATGFTYGMWAQSNSTSGRGVYGYASAPTGTTFGGSFEASSSGTNAAGVFGLASAFTGTTYGVWGQNNSTSGYGVIGINDRTSGTTYGVFGRNGSTDGYGVHGYASAASGVNYGVWGESASSTGTGVHGFASANAGATFGVHGRTASNSGWGVYGQATNLNGVTFGVRGNSSSSTGTGVSGTAIRTGVSGFASSPTGDGVFGHATSTTGVNIGVYGATSSPSGWGVLSFGNMGGNGTKSFRIDHPIDPENKYLLHYSTESPVPQNFYVGNVVTDGNGYAWVELPDYFSEINVNFKYQLTIVDDADSNAFVQAKVSKKIRDNRFQVRTNAPNVEISWRVDADRNDLYVRNRPPREVVDKEGREKGTYQYPEFYGQPPEKGVNYEAMREHAESVTSTATETTP